MPWPGVSDIDESMSACWSWPDARRPATTWSVVTPAGSWALIAPSKIRLVASPRIFGPRIAKVTLIDGQQDDER